MFGLFTSKKEVTDKEINTDNNMDDNEELNNFLVENVTNLKDLITNEYVDFSIDPKFCVVGEKYSKNMYIGILPSSVNFPTYLDDLYNFGDVDTSIHISPIDSEEAIISLSKLKTNLEVELETAQGNNRRDDMEAKVYEAKRLREEVRDGINKLYEVAIVCTSYSNSERQMENDVVRLKQLMGRKDIGLKNAIYEQEKAYMSNKPLMENLINEYHTYDKRSLACTYPFTSSNINHKNGIPIGVNIDNGLPVIYDNFDRSLNNYNMVIFAQSGGGKSTFLKMLAARGATFDDILSISIDLEPEYNDIANTLGGVVVKIANDTDTILNFFHIETDLVKNKLTNKKEEVILLDDKIDSVTAILLTMAKGFTGSNDEFYNDITRKIIKDCVKDVYKNIGITNEPRSLYEEKDIVIKEDGSIVAGNGLKDMPTLSDWYKALEVRAKENTNGTYVKYYDYLLAVMSEYTKYTRGGFTCFDGQNNVTLSKSLPFINFDVSSLNEETQLPLAQHIITDYIWESIVKKNDNGKKIRVIIDEAWRMAKLIDNKPKFPEALNFLETLFRRARKKNTSAVVISQQFNEFYNDYTQSIIRNSETKVFLPPDNTSVDDIQKVFHLTQGETQYLKHTKTGEALFKCSSSSTKLYVDIPNFELAFVETNQNKAND